MSHEPEFDYAVVLVFPGYGEERENAEAVVEAALEWLNNNKEEPGFRFAPPVSAHLEIVAGADEARGRVEADDGVAMVLLHDLDEEERDDLLRYCEARHVSACITEGGRRRAKRRKGPWKLLFGKREPGEPRAHRLTADTLTDPVGEDDDTGARVGDVIAVLALGVMEHHFGKDDPPHIEELN